MYYKEDLQHVVAVIELASCP